MHTTEMVCMVIGRLGSDVGSLSKTGMSYRAQYVDAYYRYGMHGCRKVME